MSQAKVKETYYISHGAATLAIDDSMPARGFLKSFRDTVYGGPQRPPPTSILIISGHWETDYPTVNAVSGTCDTIYDFYGFRRELYERSDQTDLSSLSATRPDPEDLPLCCKRSDQTDLSSLSATGPDPEDLPLCCKRYDQTDLSSLSATGPDPEDLPFCCKRSDQMDHSSLSTTGPDPEDLPLCCKRSDQTDLSSLSATGPDLEFPRIFPFVARGEIRLIRPLATKGHTNCGGCNQRLDLLG
ncbi:hypothetical protein Vadar_011214 [Vaccinium darrowii]|uniref:Uncharacterized protein n=1 Tax=Vaccinium darrowii TaxID=229202 RepID=A0ACB7YUN8_9ERIC|nr:hypothetical protein Vadar_011214 [Vaccinium darrowii]